MTIFNTKYNSILFILFTLVTGYLLKTIAIPDTNYKYLMLVQFVLFLFSYALFIAVRHFTLLYLSFIIFIFELNAIHTVPNIIHLSEAGIKVFSPIIIFYIIKDNSLPESLIKFSICLTFIAHGLLALNIVNTPETFYLMTGKILHLNSPQSAVFLFIAGFLDILACFVIVFNINKIKLYAIYYCVVWGLMTALARTFFYYDANLKTLLFSGVAETLVRIPNSLIPFLLLPTKKK